MTVWQNVGEELERTIVSTLRAAGLRPRPDLSVVSAKRTGAAPCGPGAVLAPRRSPALMAPGAYAVSYGWADTDSIGLSAFGRGQSVLEVRRRLPLPGGDLSEAGEWLVFAPERDDPLDVMAAAGAFLLCGGNIPPGGGIYIHH